jgi:NitT/TauT family transport system ATP-binding protein
MLEINNLTKTFTDNTGGEVCALSDVSLKIEDGQFVSVIGPSGCGKSTLLRIISGLDNATKGNVRIENNESLNAGFVFQEYALFPWMTVLDNICLGPEIQGVALSKRMDKALSYIERFELLGFENKYPKELSGGMKQRVAIARTLINDPSIILMDEPFGALDSQTRSMMQKFLYEIWSESKKSILFVTHNIDEAIYLSDSIVGLSKRPGKILLSLKIDMPFPRNVTDDEFNRYRTEIFTFLNRENQ